jgi:hypothetical protein
MSDRSVVKNGSQTPKNHSKILQIWGLKPLNGAQKTTSGSFQHAVEFSPSGSPELQPAERLWPLTNEAVANGLFEEIEQIEEALMERCVETARPDTHHKGSHQLPLVAPGGGMMFRKLFSRIPYA